MTITNLNHEGQWNLLTGVFRMKGPTSEHMMVGFCYTGSVDMYEK